MLNYQRVKTHVSQSFINVYDVQTNRCAHHKNLGIYLFSCLGTHHDKHENSIWSIKARMDIGTTLTPTIILTKSQGKCFKFTAGDPFLIFVGPFPHFWSIQVPPSGAATAEEKGGRRVGNEPEAIPNRS